MRQQHAGPELAGTVAVVTGGGRGIGRLLGHALAAAGATVGLIARSGNELAESARLITEDGGCAATATADLSKGADAGRAAGVLVLVGRARRSSRWRSR